MENKDLRIKSIGGSKFIRVPSEFIKVYNLDKYVYYVEVSKDGKTIIYRRMRKDERINLQTTDDDSI